MGASAAALQISRDASQPLEPLLREVIAEVNVNMPDRIVEAQIELKAPVSCDRGRIGQLFSNLLNNALTYGSKDQPVRVYATTDETSFELSVANVGPPIPAPALKHLFQPFYRNSVMQNREGLGLGLYIAQQIAQAHGGTLSVKSDDEETRFTLRIPLM